MCLLKRMHRSFTRASHRPPSRHSHASLSRPSRSRGAKSSHGTGSSPSSSSQFSASGMPSSSDFSSASTSSIVSVKDLLPDGPILFSFREICSCTSNFNPAQKIGRSVWKAVLRGTSVAISKKQQRGPRRGASASSIIRHLHSLHHGNIVSLLGACREGEYYYLVYEFIDASNLRDCVRSKYVRGYSALSSWVSRLQVALDVAKGLEYLHHLSVPPLLHKYIDSRNILVANDNRAKIAHVGIAQITGETIYEAHADVGIGKEGIQEETGDVKTEEEPGTPSLARARSLKIHGIQGYMPPEYANFGNVTLKYDVFSFGVVLAELLSGKEAVEMSLKKKSFLADELRSIMSETNHVGKLRLWMDPVLKDSYPLEDVLKVASIANACMDPDPENRPTMFNIASQLQKYMVSSSKWQDSVGLHKEILSMSLQPR